jgi:hypothetical protein
LLEGNVSAEKDDYGRAMRSYLDAIHLTMEYPRKSTMIHYLVGRAMQESSREAAWGVVEKLSAEEARWAAQRMQVLADHTVSLAEALESDKWFTVGLWQEQFRQGALPHVVVGSSIHYPAESNDDRVEIVKLYAKSLRYTKAQVIRNYISEMDERIADSRMPYSMRKRSWVISTDCLTEKEVDGYHHYRLMAANTDAQNRLLIVALALRAYYVENGGYPDTLTALQGKYLSRVPDDPFPSRGWLGYIRKGSGYVLYSVGPDGVDDGGRAIREPSYSQVNTRYCVEEDSSGDIVAGVNKYN